MMRRSSISSGSRSAPATAVPGRTARSKSKGTAGRRIARPILRRGSPCAKRSAVRSAEREIGGEGGAERDGSAHQCDCGSGHRREQAERTQPEDEGASEAERAPTQYTTAAGAARDAHQRRDTAGVGSQQRRRYPFCVTLGANDEVGFRRAPPVGGARGEEDRPPKPS